MRRAVLVGLLGALGWTLAGADEAGEALVRRAAAALAGAATYQAEATITIDRVAQPGRAALGGNQQKVTVSFERATGRYSVLVETPLPLAPRPQRFHLVTDGATFDVLRTRGERTVGADGQAKVDWVDYHALDVPYAGMVDFALLTRILPSLPGPGLALDLEALMTGDLRVAIGANPEAAVDAVPAEDGLPGVTFPFGALATVVARFDPDNGLVRSVLVTAVDPAKFGQIRSIRYEYAPAPLGAPIDAARFAVATADSVASETKLDLLGTAGPLLLMGQAAPDFELTDLKGETVKLGDLGDAVVILDFWATWCGPCKVGLPRLEALAAELAQAGKPVRVFCVNQREGEDKVVPFWAEQKYTMEVLYDRDGAVGDRYGVSAIPTTVVIGGGQVTWATVGVGPEEQVRAAVEAALAR